MNRGKCKRIFHHDRHFVGVICKSATGASQREGRAKYYRIADILRGFQALLNAVGYLRWNNRFTDSLAKLFKKLSVLGTFYALGVGTQKLDFALLQNAFFGKLHCKVKPCLTADSGNDSVRTFVSANPCDKFKGQRLHVNLVGDGGISHDGRGVGVAQNYLVALFLKGEARLSSGIVKLCRLTDNNRSRADNQDLFYISALGHPASLLSCFPEICQKDSVSPADRARFRGDTAR